ncbi:flavin-containing monooxygenase [Alphaproteobacteria bacterium LSUCC0684]
MSLDPSPHQQIHNHPVANGTKLHLDAVIVGAGFSGLYQLHCLRDTLEMNAAVLEAGDGVGGTWYWNRYPGARCDSESHSYCYYFNRDLLDEWRWSERYPGQAEILSYLNFCADKLDLRRDIYLNQRVDQAVWDEASGRWQVRCTSGLEVEARYLITAVGCLSSANLPSINGITRFKGEIYHTGEWPHDGVDFEGKTVVVVGTGSTGIQAIPVIAAEACKLTVLQRTPNFSVPARNAPLKEDFHPNFCEEIDSWHQKMLISRHGHPWSAPPRKLCETPEDERNAILEDAWRIGGLRFRESFDDILLDERSNHLMSDFIRAKIRGIVDDAETAEKLLPLDHPFGTKRPPIDTNYFETYNRDNVELVDIRPNPIDCLDEDGVKLADGAHIPADIIVFATGFDAMSGALLKMGIVGRDACTLDEAWKEGPKTYLGLGVHGFPNMFTITGPGSPSVLTNMPRSIEQHVDWITALLKHAESSGIAKIEAEDDAMRNWTDHVTDTANLTLLPKANHSWYLGANVPGKPRVFMPYAGGLDRYRSHCDEVAAKGYPGFRMTGIHDHIRCV